MTNWKPIETAPKDGRTILACGRGTDGYFVCDVKWKHETWMLFDPALDDHSFPTDYLTHWMPLPEPPK